VVEGALADLGSAVAVQSDLATELGLGAGDSPDVTYAPGGDATPLEVVAVVG